MNSTSNPMRDLLRDLRMSRNQLAVAAGLSPGTIQLLEQGATKAISQNVLEAVARVAGSERAAQLAAAYPSFRAELAKKTTAEGLRATFLTKLKALDPAGKPEVNSLRSNLVAIIENPLQANAESFCLLAAGCVEFADHALGRVISELEESESLGELETRFGKARDYFDQAAKWLWFARTLVTAAAVSK